MGGQMGNVRVTVQNLKVLKIFADENLVVISGAIPGAKGSTVLIQN
jgi:large subunit ribosomal protein L3